MSDNLGYTEGSGKTIRSRDRSGVHAQVLGLDVGDSTEVLLTVGQKVKALSIPVALASDADALPTIPGGYSTVGDGSKNVTTAGTRVQLSSSSVPCRRVEIVAKSGNVGTIWVGGSTIAAGRGRPLVALQSTILEVSNLNLVYFDSDVSNEGVTWIYFN